MKITFVVLAFFCSTQVALAQKISCSNQKSGKAFLSANLKGLNDGRIYIDGIKILSPKESMALARNSMANDIESSDYENYRFRSTPKSLYLVDPNEDLGIFGRFGRSLSGEPHGSDDFIGAGRKWVYQDQSSEFSGGNYVLFVFDYQNAVKKQSFKLKAQHVIDEYEIPMDQRLVCQFN